MGFSWISPHGFSKTAFVFSFGLCPTRPVKYKPQDVSTPFSHGGKLSGLTEQVSRVSMVSVGPIFHFPVSPRLQGCLAVHSNNSILSKNPRSDLFIYALGKHIQKSWDEITAKCNFPVMLKPEQWTFYNSYYWHHKWTEMGFNDQKWDD